MAGQQDVSRDAGIEGARTVVPRCRFCATVLRLTLLDLGSMPLSNALLAPRDLQTPEPTYPLHARVCPECRLVQVDDVVPPTELFSDYAYFSSYSATWMRHSREFAMRAIDLHDLTIDSLVVEIASNDGYLLQHFRERGIPVLGIDPAANVAEVAESRGVPTEVTFFGLGAAQALRERGVCPDLIVANNVLAHVPDLNDFVAGIATLLPPQATASLEFPHLLRLLEEVQFDTIYHEHFSYFSLLAAERVFGAHGLAVAEVEELPTHGGSLRVTVRHAADVAVPAGSVEAVRRREHQAGLDQDGIYLGFADRADRVRTGLRSLIDDAMARSQAVSAYGAAAKGNTLLNYCGLTSREIRHVADRSPHKQGLYMPGSRVPIVDPGTLIASRPDLVLILPWNLRHEISDQLAEVRGWDGKFVVPIPYVEVF